MELVAFAWLGTLNNLNLQQDTIELDHFTNAQTTEELQSLIASVGQGEAVIRLGHNGSIVLPGVITSKLQQVIQAGTLLLDSAESTALNLGVAAGRSASSLPQSERLQDASSVCRLVRGDTATRPFL